jgi:hypothetical protein
MNDYYPQVVQNISEFKAIIDAEYPEFELKSNAITRVTNDAHLSTMSLERVEQWERILGISQLEGSTLDDRRETIIARIRGQGKLNTSLINSIVNVFTGGTANSWVEGSTLYVEITPPPNNKQFKFANVEQELKNKVPSHLGFNITRRYTTWGELKDMFKTWGDVHNELPTWMDVYLLAPPRG